LFRAGGFIGFLPFYLDEEYGAARGKAEGWKGMESNEEMHGGPSGLGGRRALPPRGRAGGGVRCQGGAELKRTHGAEAI